MYLQNKIYTSKLIPKLFLYGKAVLGGVWSRGAWSGIVRYGKYYVKGELKNGEILGVVTKLDYFEIFSCGTERLIPDLATYPDDSIQIVVQKMLEHRVRSVLVTDKSKKILKGIITRGDIMRFVEVE